MNITPHTSSNAPSLLDTLKRVSRFKVLVFVVVVAGLYAYLILQISQASSIQPITEQSSSNTATPKIDQQTVDQLQQLQDNSVSVKALFNEARSNPFE